MEIDDTISDTDKLPLMVKWWTASHQLMIDAGLNRSHLAAACQSTSESPTPCRLLLIRGIRALWSCDTRRIAELLVVGCLTSEKL